jgi:hypothetical protein
VESFAELQAREEELAREWQWLVDVLNKIARARAENEEAETFRLLQQQCVAVGQRRVELHLRIAALTGPSS